MKNSFRTKIVATFLVVIVFSMLLLTLLSNVLLKPVFIQNSKNTMIKYFSVIDEAFSESYTKCREALQLLNESYGITSFVTDENGKTICSYTTGNNSKVNRRWVLRLIGLYDERENGENYLFKNRKEESDNIRRLIYIRKTSDGNYIIMKKAVKGIEQDTRIVCFFLMALGVTVAVIGTATWSVFTRKITDNIKKMSDITRRMSELDFSEKINLESDDEIGVLADSIDQLSGELEESIKEMREDVEKQKRLIRDISHELKTPVTTVKGYIENIEAVSSENPVLRNYCEIASEECDEINNLVEEMLEMSRLESQSYVCDMETMSVKAIEKALTEKLVFEFRDNRFSFSFDEAEIYCNSVLIIRAVMNFIKNAVKYGDEDACIEICGSKMKEHYEFSVANYGNEIPEGEKENIWDLFYKNDKSRHRNESHGIGLSMVRQIAKLHGGSVNLICKDGKNIFSFTVPENL